MELWHHSGIIPTYAPLLAPVHDVAADLARSAGRRHGHGQHAQCAPPPACGHHGSAGYARARSTPCIAGSRSRRCIARHWHRPRQHTLRHHHGQRTGLRWQPPQRPLCGVRHLPFRASHTGRISTTFRLAGPRTTGQRAVTLCQRHAGASHQTTHRLRPDTQSASAVCCLPMAKAAADAWFVLSQEIAACAPRPLLPRGCSL